MWFMELYSIEGFYEETLSLFEKIVSAQVSGAKIDANLDYKVFYIFQTDF